MANDSLESTNTMSHPERQGCLTLTENRSTGGECYRLFTCVNQVSVVLVGSVSRNRVSPDLRIQLFLCRVWSHPKDTILTLQPNSHALLQVFRNQRRHANSQIDIITIFELLCSSPSNTMADGIRVFLFRCGSCVRGECDILYLLLRSGGNNTVNIDAGYVDSIWGYRANGNYGLRLAR